MHFGASARFLIIAMKKTFTTRMPDRVGAFYLADRCITDLGLNITRVSYNKAVDTHTLFLEVEGAPETLERAESALAALGYLSDETDPGQVLLIEFKLRDEPGALLPVLALIASCVIGMIYTVPIFQNGSVCREQERNFGLYASGGTSVRCARSGL